MSLALKSRWAAVVQKSVFGLKIGLIIYGINYTIKRCSNKECCKQCRYVMFKGIKWPVQKLAQGTTQKLQNNDLYLNSKILLMLIYMTYIFLFCIHGMHHMPQGRQIESVHFDMASARSWYFNDLLLPHKPVDSFYWDLQRQTDAFWHSVKTCKWSSVSTTNP